MADGAGLLRLRRELLDVAFDAGLVSGEFQVQLFVAFGRRHYIFHQIALIMAGIAF